MAGHLTVSLEEIVQRLIVRHAESGSMGFVSRLVGGTLEGGSLPNEPDPPFLHQCDVFDDPTQAQLTDRGREPDLGLAQTLDRTSKEVTVLARALRTSSRSGLKGAEDAFWGSLLGVGSGTAHRTGLSGQIPS